MNADEGLETLEWVEASIPRPISTWRRILYIGWHHCTFDAWSGWFFFEWVRARTKGQCSATVLDVVPKNIEYLNRHLLCERYPINAVLSSIQDFKSEPHSYDACVWWHGPEHVEQNEVEGVVRNLERWTKAGGVVLMGCPLGRDINTMEIGPGEGRQFKHIVTVAEWVDVCDISSVVLNQEVFGAARKKFILRDYSQDLGGFYDVVTFWYVMHHVRSSELRAFLEFCTRALNPDGRLIFNSVDIDDERCGRESWVMPEGDGIKTTEHTTDSVMKALTDVGHEVVQESRLDWNNIVMVTQGKQ